ncbi:hypothetical protein [Brevibacillus nitrificans]|uniref:Rok-like winged helix domain-containing protein n=1 Tax=Brevibacillus nitrificans TaxID=651560 RepID=UPI0028645438|nr:hypothetical protein [Brevibacillus nitrificans]MDR7318032.1 hypothetical protein [Brevibacillus nitrificans]
MTAKKRNEIPKNIVKLQLKKQILKDKFREQDKELERQLHNELDKLSASLSRTGETGRNIIMEEKKYKSLKEEVLPFVLQTLLAASDPLSVKVISDSIQRGLGAQYQNITVIMKQIMKYDGRIYKVGRSSYTVRRSEND